MNKSQYKFRRNKIKRFAKRHGLTYRQTLHIIEDVEAVRDIANCIAMPEFLRTEINRLLSLHLQRKKYR